ncbi:uncharacterized protein [Amphiura filiformis]|uniref:uncharacterized protein n=1 Tax=Amphiura filiformis TaxID=82378 RepID=UPI003B21B9C5
MGHLLQLVLTGLLLWITATNAQDNTASSIYNVTVIAGEDLYLEWLNEDPIYVNWVKDSVVVADQEGRIFIIPDKGLLVLNSEWKDGGYYTCVVITRQLDIVEKVFRVDVDQNTAVDDRGSMISNITVLAGEDFYLEWINLNPSHVIWIKDNVTISNTDVAAWDERIVTILEQGLLILNSEWEDQGFYTCVVLTSQNYVRRQMFRVDINTQSIDADEDIEEDICGYPRVRGKIVGGRISEHGQSPWMAMLWSNALRKPVCGGVLLNQRWIVTAGHCFSDPMVLNSSDTDSFEVRLGEHSTTEDDGTEVIVGLKTVIINPNFDKNNYDSDIALLNLRKPVTYTDYISPLCLPNKIQSQTLVRAGKKGFVTGWGDIVENGDYSRELKRVRLSIVDQQSCVDAHARYEITDNMFCAEANGRDACKGDSGGPFAVKDGSQWYLVGLVSWGIGCARLQVPGVYTRVQRYRQWIDDVIDDEMDICEDLREDLVLKTMKIGILETSVLELQKQLQVDGNWTVWAPWTMCSKSCGGGRKSRIRTCNNPEPRYNGRYCAGPAHEEDVCNLAACPVNGGWSSWEPWSSCNETCDGGIQRRYRRCRNPTPRYGGRYCIGKATDFQTCNEEPCRQGIGLPPSSLRATDITDNAITLHWKAGGPHTVFYLVQYMNTDTQKADAVEVYGTQFTLDNLEIGSNYVIRVFGLNSQGAGSPSDIIYVRTGEVLIPSSEAPFPEIAPPQLFHSSTVFPVDPCEVHSDPTDEGAIQYGISPNSHSAYPTLPDEFTRSGTVSLEVRTGASDGIVFYVADKRQFDQNFAYIRDGYLIFGFDYGSGPLLLRSSIRINDSEWHSLELQRIRRTGIIKVDGMEVGRGLLGGSSEYLRTSDPFYVGGAPRGYALKGVDEESKVSLLGCIKILALNGQILGTPDVELDVQPCNIGCEERGMYFGAEGGYVILDQRYSVGANKEVRLSVKPRSTSGVIFSVADTPQGDFLSLEMVNGTLYLRSDNGGGEFEATYKPSEGPTVLYDGKWHDIIANKFGNALQLIVDGDEGEISAGSYRAIATNTNHPLYLGGLPDGVSHRGIRTNEVFVGCIRNIQFGGNIIDFKRVETVEGDVDVQACPAR